jgi:hypothetical protein
MRKQVFIKIYDSAGVYKGLFTDFAFSSFTKDINGGIGDIEIIIPRKFDDFDEAIEVGNELRIIVADKEAIQGQVVCSAEINEVDAFGGPSESVRIFCSGYLFQLALDILEDDKTVYFNYSSQELSTTIKDILDKFNAENSVSKVDYASGSVEDTGISESVEIYLNTPLEALRHTISKSAGEHYFYVGADNVFYLKEIADAPKHLFVFGKDIVDISYNRNTKSTRTGVLFYNGLTDIDDDLVFKLYTKNVDKHGRRIERWRDSRFKEAGANKFSNRFLDLYGDVINTVSLRIIDSNLANGYDIESIEVGDTCKVLNVRENPALTDNMLITSVTYSVDYVDIVIADTSEYVERTLQEFRNMFNMFAFEDNLPKQYTI